MKNLVATLILSALLDAPCGGRADSLDLDALVMIAERLELPMPPREARLVLAHTGSSRVLGAKSTSRDPGIYSPAYLIEEKPDGSVVILRGTERETLKAPRNWEPSLQPFSTGEVKPRPGGHIVCFSRLSTFVCAVQTAALGDEDTARAIWARFYESGSWIEADFGEHIAEQKKKPEPLLGRCVFDHLRNSLLREGVDRKRVLERMAGLLAEFPQLIAYRHMRLVEDLAATVNAVPPSPGSVEALLLDWAAKPSVMQHPLGCGESDADAPARRILALGFDAVPELIALMRDPRVTAHESPADMKAPAEIKRVGELARELVRKIAGYQTPFHNYEDDTDAILAWWDKARSQDEFAALRDCVFARKGGNIAWVNKTPALIIAQKFPDKLSALCDEFTEHATPDAQSYNLAEAIVASGLPKETRVRQLSEFARRGSLEHKRCVLQILAHLDDNACAALVLPLLKSLPTDASGPYWTCTEAKFTHVVVRIEDEKVWREYLRTAQRSSTWLRMEMMNPMNYRDISEKSLGLRLAFLSAFLDDAAIRDMADEREFEGPCAGFTFPRLGVRDLAAIKLASLLEMEDKPDEYWTDAQWEELRRKVKERLMERELPELWIRIK